MFAGTLAPAAVVVAPAPAFAEQTDAEKASGLGQLAAKRAKEHAYGFAAKLFHEAFSLDPTGWRYLYSAARCEELEGKLEEARRDYEAYLAGAPQDHELRGKAKDQRKVVLAALKKPAAPPAVIEPAPAPVVVPAPAPVVRAVAKPVVPPANTVEPVAPAGPSAKPQAAGPNADAAATSGTKVAPEAMIGVSKGDEAAAWRKPLGWSLAAVGGISAAVGAVVWGIAMGDKGDLESKLSQTNSSGVITGIDEATATSDRTRIDGNLRLGSGAALAGVGVAALGLYVALGHGDAAEVRPVLRRGGGGVEVAFGF